jgi:hypothetical protein
LLVFQREICLRTKVYVLGAVSRELPVHRAGPHTPRRDECVDQIASHLRPLRMHYLDRRNGLQTHSPTLRMTHEEAKGLYMQSRARPQQFLDGPFKSFQFWNFPENPYVFYGRIRRRSCREHFNTPPCVPSTESERSDRRANSRHSTLKSQEIEYCP